MNIGLLTLDIFFPDSHSLKDKRIVLRRLKDRLRKFNVSIAECDHQDLWQRSTVGIVSISLGRHPGKNSEHRRRRVGRFSAGI
jgi:uncharacterized protein YlxP (DUF503 family)